MTLIKILNFFFFLLAARLREQVDYILNIYTAFLRLILPPSSRMTREAPPALDGGSIR